MKPEYLQFTVDAMSSIQRGAVVEILKTGEISVEVRVQAHRLILCDFLETSDSTSVSLQIGDRVLILMPKTSEENGCVLGKIGRYSHPENQEELKSPDNVVIEAKKQLDLKCGKSSIMLKTNGKLIVKAVDIVSRAKRNNKIKGGSVNIN